MISFSIGGYSDIFKGLAGSCVLLCAMMLALRIGVSSFNVNRENAVLSIKCCSGSFPCSEKGHTFLSRLQMGQV